MALAVLSIFREVILLQRGLCSEGLCISGTSIWVSVTRSYFVIKPPKTVREPKPCWGQPCRVSASRVPRNGEGPGWQMGTYKFNHTQKIICALHKWVSQTVLREQFDYFTVFAHMLPIETCSGGLPLTLP